MDKFGPFVRTVQPLYLTEIQWSRLFAITWLDDALRNPQSQDKDPLPATPFRDLLESNPNNAVLEVPKYWRHIHQVMRPDVPLATVQDKKSK